MPEQNLIGIEVAINQVVEMLLHCLCLLVIYHFEKLILSIIIIHHYQQLKSSSIIYSHTSRNSSAIISNHRINKPKSIKNSIPTYLRNIKSFINSLINFQLMTVIELTKTSENGQQVKYFTDSTYFNQNDITKLQNVFNQATKFRTTATIIAGLVSYHVFHYVPTVKTRVASSFAHKNAGSLLALGVSALTYLVSSFGVISRVHSEEKRVVTNNSHPGWYDKNRVVNPNRVFFELDDSKNNQIRIIHSGLTTNSAERLFPDFVVGNLPSRPHEPVTKLHH